jgi:hypothetical protein
MTDELRAYIAAEIAKLEQTRQEIVTAAQAQINLLAALIDAKKKELSE